MALTLVVRCEEAGELPAITFDSPRLIIGRGDGCDLRLPDPSVSQHHASIRQRGSDYIVIDEGSTNGTFAGPVRLAPQAPRVLRSGESLRFGRIWVDVRLEAATATSQMPFATKDLALQLVMKSLEAQGEVAIPQLVVRDGDNAGTILALEKSDHRYVLGRSAVADLVILDTNASRRHVEVWRQGARVLLRDLGSKNGSKLNSTYLLPSKEVEWPEGAILSIGAEQIVLQDPAREALTEISRAADAHLSDAEQSELASAAPFATEPGAPAAGSANPPNQRAKRPTRPAQTRSGRVTTADLGVVILALAVLGASLLGLLWMLGGK